MWRHDRSWVENFLSSWAVLLLAAMSVVSLALRYVRDPVSCHYVYPQANEYFTDDCFRQTSLLIRSQEFVEFARQTWMGSRRGSSRGKEFPNPFTLWPKQRTFHHWVPFALGIGAILCLLPHVVWRMLSGFLWLDSHALVRCLATEGTSSSDNPSDKSGSGGHVRDSALVVTAGLRGGNWLLTAAAVGRKVTACVVCFLLMTLIAVLFKPPLAGGGAGGEVPAGKGDDLMMSSSGTASAAVNVTVPEYLEDVPLPLGPFFCTVVFTHNQNTQTITMQCLIPLNQVFSKAFVFLFYLFFLLLALCLLDLFYWLGRLFLPNVRDVTLIRNLSVLSQSESGRPVSSSTASSSTAQLYDFAQTLGADGRLLLALITDHCGLVASLRFTSQLWKAFRVQTPSSPRSLGPASQSLSAAPSADSGAGDWKRGEEDEGGPGSTADDIPLELVNVS